MLEGRLGPLDDAKPVHGDIHPAISCDDFYSPLLAEFAAAG
jgi:hypothetical protein